MYTITLEHNFETAHRLLHPDSPTKCRSIHGHSWWVRASIEGAMLNEQGMLVEFGAFKKAWRDFLDTQLDHHLVMHCDDPMAKAILSVQPDARLRLLPFDPTTENLARWLHERTSEVLLEVAGVRDLRILQVHLQETRVNAASFQVC